MPDALGARLALAFVVLCALLLVYAAVHWARRRGQVTEELTRRGWQRLDLPDDPAARRQAVTDRVPDGLFHPNGCPRRIRDGDFEVFDVLPRILDAWSTTWAGTHLELLEVSIAREQRRPREAGSSSQLNRTVLRFTPNPEPGPPDLLIEERVLFKSRVDGAVSLHGRDHLDPHYFVFSDASPDELERWIDEAVVDLLARHRFWTLAVHDGTFFLTRNLSLQRLRDLPSFLEEGRALIEALLAGSRR